MKTEPIKLEIDPDIPRPHPATKCRTVSPALAGLPGRAARLPDRRGCDCCHKKEPQTLWLHHFLWPNHMIPRAVASSRKVWQKVHPASTCFFSADLSASYFQIPIAEESQPLTTFLTPRGKFQMTRLSMGLSASSDQFNQRVGGVLDKLPQPQCRPEKLMTSSAMHLG